MQNEFLEILAIKDFSRKLILANVLARKTFAANYEASILPYANLLEKNLNAWNCGRTLTVVRTMSDVDQIEKDITQAQANSIRLLIMSAGYDFIQADPVKSN